MSRVCFDGDGEGSAKHFTCHGLGTFDCWDSVQRYALADGKIRLLSDDISNPVVCDAQVVPKLQLRMHNCEGADAGFSERIYRWIEQ
jgi:hypothetical protein